MADTDATPRDQRTGGELNSAMARAIVAVHRDHVGRGPTKAQVFFRHEIVVAVLSDVMTSRERTLAANGHRDAVSDMRRELQTAMRGELVAAVERLTGRRVTALMSAIDVDHDTAAEVFVLDRPVPSGEDEARRDP